MTAATASDAVCSGIRDTTAQPISLRVVTPLAI